MASKEIAIKINYENIDAYIEKANHLIELLSEVKALISSLNVDPGN